MDNILKISITPTWHAIDDIRQKIPAMLKDIKQDAVDAAVMVTSELLENAVKYGGKVGSASEIEFELSCENNLIKIQVSNVVESKNDLDDVLKHIDLIRNSTNPAELYTQRLMELLQKNSGKTQLGLYSIAYEGEFKLDCKVNNDRLLVIAQRRV